MRDPPRTITTALDHQKRDRSWHNEESALEGEDWAGDDYRQSDRPSCPKDLAEQPKQYRDSNAGSQPKQREGEELSPSGGERDSKTSNGQRNWN